MNGHQSESRPIKMNTDQNSSFLTVSSMAQWFMQALQQLENTRDLTQFLERFSDQVEIKSVALPQAHRGRKYAEEFWKSYLSQFEKIQTQFIRVIENHDIAVLEWISNAILPDGQAMQYEGISVIEYANQQILRFRTYFDTAAFVKV